MNALASVATTDAVAARPARVRPRRPWLTPARLGVYGFLLISAAFFLLPLYVMIATSLKSMDQIRLGAIFSLPSQPAFDAWVQAWSSACTGLECRGIQVGFWNSVRIVIPSTVLSILVGAVNGYALSFWKPRGASTLFAILLMGAFIPVQVMVYPLVRVLATVHLFSSLPGIVVIHTIFGMPVMTLLFRN